MANFGLPDFSPIDLASTPEQPYLRLDDDDPFCGNDNNRRAAAHAAAEASGVTAEVPAADAGSKAGASKQPKTPSAPPAWKPKA